MMKTKTLTMSLLLFLALSAFAQKQYRTAKTTNKLVLNLDGISVEGYKGDEIIFTLQEGLNEQIDERARGLKAVSAAGFTDNTGLGIQLSEKGGELVVDKVGKTIAGSILVKVPEEMNVAVMSTSVNFMPIVIKNLKSEITVSTNVNGLTLDNNSGPVSATSTRGNIEAIFPSPPNGPVALSSMYGFVDISIPEKTAADLTVSSRYGQIYTGTELQVKLNPSVASNQRMEGLVKTENSRIDAEKIKLFSKTATTTANPIANAEKIRTALQMSVYAAVARGESNKPAAPMVGKINGGGSGIVLKSTFGNIYLRKH